MSTNAASPCPLVRLRREELSSAELPEWFHAVDPEGFTRFDAKAECCRRGRSGKRHHLLASRWMAESA